MNVFENLVIPASANHLALHEYILVIALALFIPYFCMVFGGLTLSLLYNRLHNKYHDDRFQRFSGEVIEKLAVKNGLFALGIIPALSILLSYIQLMAGAGSIALSMMTLSVLIIILGLALTYRYKGTFRFRKMIKRFKENLKLKRKKEDEEVKEIESELKSTSSISGYIGWIMLLIGMYIFAGSLALANSPDRWSNTYNIIQLLFSFGTFFNFVFFIAASGLITGASILFFFFVWDGGIKDKNTEYEKFVSNIALIIAIISSIVLPAVMILNMTYIPFWAYSQSAYLWAFISISGALILASVLYFAIKRTETGYGTVIFAAAVLIILFNILKDQAVFASANIEQRAIILQKGDEYEKLKKSKVVSTISVNGEEVFTQRCASCHKFDAKVVGPAYNDVVPKYGGDVQKLAGYIMNPVKVDPAYPPMPNPGIKQKEAQAVADYLIKNSGNK